jgi:hypothetical protein
MWSKPMSKKGVFMQAALHFAKSENALGANTGEKNQLYGLYKQCWSTRICIDVPREFRLS